MTTKKPASTGRKPAAAKPDIMMQGFSALLEGLKSLASTQIEVVDMIKEIKKSTAAKEEVYYESIDKDREVSYLYNVFPISGTTEGEEDIDFANRRVVSTEKQAHEDGLTYFGGKYKVVKSEKF